MTGSGAVTFPPGVQLILPAPGATLSELQGVLSSWGSAVLSELGGAAGPAAKSVLCSKLTEYAVLVATYLIERVGLGIESPIAAALVAFAEEVASGLRSRFC